MEFKQLTFLGLLKNHDLGDSIFSGRTLDLLIEKKVLVENSDISDEKYSAGNDGCRWSCDINNKMYSISFNLIEEIYYVFNNHLQSVDYDYTYLNTYDYKKTISYNLMDIVEKYDSIIKDSDKLEYVSNLMQQIQKECFDLQLSEFRKPSTRIHDIVRFDDSYPLRRLFNYYKNDHLEWKDWLYQCFGSNKLLLGYLKFEEDETYSFGDFIHSEFFKDYDFVMIWLSFIGLDKLTVFLIDELEKLDHSQLKVKKDKNSNNRTLKELFAGDNYDEVIDLLIQHQVISKIKVGYIVNIPEKFKKRGREMFICAIGNNLSEKGYLKFCDYTEIVNALNKLFCNSNVTKQNYNSLLNSPKLNTYLGFTNFL